MNRIFPLATLLALTAAGHAQGVGGLAQVSIVDRDSGAVLSPHYYRGEYWVAGSPGARYAIEVRNRLGERVLAVASVDGVNVISGATAAWDQTGYVFSPRERYQITGWRKSDQEIAAFTFTDSPNSYAERTGRPANVGVIGVAIFRERPPQPVDGSPLIGRDPGRAPDAAAAPRGAAPEDAARAGAASEERLAGPSMDAAAPAPLTAEASMLRPPVPKLGTGHGEREYSQVSHTDFQRMQQQPNEVIRIRYDSLDNLLAMGIVKRPPPPPTGANPFPASPERQYVPDPPG
jgi:hypothetical protein